MLVNELRAARSMRDFHRLPVERRLVVFYAASKDDWSDLARSIQRLNVAQNRSVAYLTSDPDDPLLTTSQPNLHVFFVGSGRTRRRTFSKLDANLVVVPKPYVGKTIPTSKKTDVHYALVLGTLQSVTTLYTKRELSPYQTIFCSGQHQRAELDDLLDGGTRLLELGSGRIDSILERRRRMPEEVDSYRTPSVLVAPDDPAFFKSVGERTVGRLLDAGNKVIVHLRPGLPGRRRIARRLRKAFGDQSKFSVNLRQPSLSLLFTSQVVVTDWSDVALQYALGMERPVVFVDLPRSDRRARGTTHRRPLEITLRAQLGEVVSRDRISQLPTVCQRLIADGGARQASLAALRERLIYNPKISGAVGSAAIEALTMRHDPQAALDRALEELRRDGDLAA